MAMQPVRSPMSPPTFTAEKDISYGIRALLIGGGVVLIGLGVYAILIDDTQVKADSAIAALVATGVLLMIAGGFANRIKSFKGAGVEVVLHDIQAKTNALTAKHQA